MKTVDDPRHKKRQRLVRELFKYDFHSQAISQETKNIFAQKDILDAQISKAASHFPINKINKVDLAILRLAVYELLITKTDKKNVIIDEAIELAKTFGSKSSAAFINGVLDKITSNE